ncbi:K+-sensing histidine kinase KdpD [Bradyrhizobium sp. LM2.7]
MIAAHANPVAALFRRLSRVAGIVVIFSVVGPLTTAALVSVTVTALGAAMLQMFLALLDLEALRALLSIAVVLLAIATVLASFLPAAIAGLIFALAVVYADLNMIWMAWLAAAVAAAGFVALGVFIVPSETSAVILPSVRSAPEALKLSAMLAILAVIPASLCWWLAKPLHRVILPA